jgi:rhamnosyltransferase
MVPVLLINRNIVMYPLTAAEHIECAVVTYHPDRAVLATVLASVAPQVKSVLIIANDYISWTGPIPENTTLVNQGSNIGLGAAYNVAASRARQNGATHLLLLDQDSVPMAGMVTALLRAHGQPGPIAAVGPLWRDSRTGRDGFFLRHGSSGSRRYTPQAGEIVRVEYLISSGSLISLDALADIGPFDEKLFIEHVDTDWTLRALAKGYRLYGVGDARLDHAFGEATLATSPLDRRSVFVYRPERNYYLLRNSIVLWRRFYAPWNWVFRDVCRTCALTVFYALFVPPRVERIRSAFRAVRDGLRMK